VVELGAPEQAMAATKTYTASLAAVAAVVVDIVGDEQRRRELASAPELLAGQLALSDPVGAAIEAAVGWTRAAVIGRGANYSTAFETALKVKELTRVATEPYSPADFLHGPVALAGPDYPVLALAPTGATRDNVVEAVDTVRARGGRVVVVSDDRTAAVGDEPWIPLVAAPEWLSPLVAVVPGQLFAVGLAERLGIDADHPFGLPKVTRTR
jgi:glucosamine--fructose-6-phosphate aminotransferase (isomerizing)